jgi:hypothetical protein
MGCSAIVRK